LVGLITANDELIVLADGLLAEPDQAVALIEQGQGVLVQPIELGQPAGYERIDLNHSAAGAMRLPGSLAERLAELPSDCDTVSSLQRIALQGGVAQRMLPSGLREGGAWRLLRDEGEAQMAENEWFRLHTGIAPASSVSETIARLAVRSIGPALMHSGGGGSGVGALAFAVMLLALGAGWFQLSATGLFLCAAADILRRAASLLLRIERRSLNLPRSIFPRQLLFGWGLDLVLILILSWSLPLVPDEAPLAQAFPAIMLVMMLRLVPQLLQTRWAYWLEDRGVFAFALGLVVVAAGGMPNGLVGGLAVALALFGAAWRDRSSRLTRA
jgi:hypothetical protein